jgi:tRNA A37 threonylcarbamoyladenosine synthetase subunit TsaC/SUA5/YrdC
MNSRTSSDKRSTRRKHENEWSQTASADGGVQAGAAELERSSTAPHAPVQSAAGRHRIMHKKSIEWRRGREQVAVDLLLEGGRMIVSPTKVGYIIMATDMGGLKRKFASKQRSLNKPGVVLCGSMEQLRKLAVLNAEIDALYQTAWDNDVLLGCVLPWKENAKKHIPCDGSRSLMMDRRSTSCFVIKFGEPSELIARGLWADHGTLAFASSANPSGKGNAGRVEGIGERIHDEADLVIAADEYVRSIQPDRDATTRHEQGVMVSMVDPEGRLVPEQRGRRAVQPAPVLIRTGLCVERIMSMLTSTFPSWDFRHGTYY